MTLRSISAGTGEFVGPVDPRNDARFRLFRCRSEELAEPGYSGAPILSTELGAVVGIQIKAVTVTHGARDTVLAMPLYRVASAWNRLEEIEAEQATSSISPAGRQVIVVAVQSGDLGRRISVNLRARGFAVRQVCRSRGRDLGTRAALSHGGSGGTPSCRWPGQHSGVHAGACRGCRGPTGPLHRGRRFRFGATGISTKFHHS